MTITNFYNYGTMNEVEAGATQINNYYGKSEEGQEVEQMQEICSKGLEALRSEAAEELMEELVDAGLLDENWQPLGLTCFERAIVAKAVCGRLKINGVWQLFGSLWKEKPETLRSYHNKALDLKKTLLFQDKLKKILG